MRRQIAIIAVAVVAVVAIALGARHLLGAKAGIPGGGLGDPGGAASRHAGHLRRHPDRHAPEPGQPARRARGDQLLGVVVRPCQAEAPVLARVARDTRRLGVHFVGIDVRDNPSAGLAFEQGHHVPFPSISDPGNLIAARFGPGAPTATPSTYILDARGRIAWAFFGSTTYGQLEPAVLQVARS